jgi:hypothetical protein
MIAIKDILIINAVNIQNMPQPFDNVNYHHWHEGMEIAYWEEGDSYLFKDMLNVFCISRTFLNELVKAQLTRKDD